MKNLRVVASVSAFVVVAAIGTSFIFAKSNPIATEPSLTAAPTPTPMLTTMSTLTEVEYQETVDHFTYGQTKKGFLYETHGTGATKLMDSEVLVYMADRSEETQSILVNSYKAIDAFIIGTAVDQGLGDYVISDYELSIYLTEYHKRFSGLFADEIERGKEVLKNAEPGVPIPWGGKSLDQLLVRIALEVDKAFEGAIDNLQWSNLESGREAPLEGIDEEWEYDHMRQIDGDTRLMKARDILQRYSSWLFDGKLSAEGVVREDRPIPEQFKYVAPIR